MKLRDRISDDLTIGMKARDAGRVAVLRMMKTAVRNDEIDRRQELNDSEAIPILITLIKQRQDSVEQFRAGGRSDLADKEEAEIKIIEEYLPERVSDAEIASIVGEVVREIEATTMRDMGTVMKQCMSRFTGKFVDGKKVSSIVKQRLQAGGN